MIVFLTTGSHSYTHDYVADHLAPFYQIGYRSFFARRRLKQATYIFSDFDRLSFWQLELAASFYRQIKAAGWRVLNDPARALHRLELLQALKASELNSFSVWTASAVRTVNRYPVFLRTQSAHRGPLTDLLETPEALETALERLIVEGYPIHDLMICEYRAEPNADSVFRKLSVYRVGDRMIACPSVYEKHWSAKYGELGIAGEHAYRQDLDDIINGRYTADLKPYFDLANVEYGRADFGLVKGQVEVYEINTNPSIEPAKDHPFSDRVRAFQHSDEQYLTALADLDTGETKETIQVELPQQLAERPYRERLFPGYQWLP